MMDAVTLLPCCKVIFGHEIHTYNANVYTKEIVPHTTLQALAFMLSLFFPHLHCFLIITIFNYTFFKKKLITLKECFKIMYCL